MVMFTFAFPVIIRLDGDVDVIMWGCRTIFHVTFGVLT
jgi:hypothetical protein